MSNNVQLKLIKVMKKLMLAAFLLFGGIAFVNAQEKDSTQVQPPTEQTPTQDQDRQQIQVSELPQAIKTSLESTDFTGWNISQAYRSTQKDASDETKSMEIYIVELKNGADTKSVKFDKDGNKIDQKKDEK
jgi:hypothetical protein